MRILLLLLFLSAHFNDTAAQFSIMGNRIPHQVLGGVGGGLVGGAAGGILGRLQAGENPQGFEDIAGVVVGAMVGYTIGNGVGVYLMGNSATEKGSLGWTLAGSATGLVIGVGLGANMGEALVPFAAASVMVGSMAGYNLTRKSAVAFLQPASRSIGEQASIRTPLDIPKPSLTWVRIGF
jgi:hypothetical protein